MILTAITFYITISSILVPITSLLLPGFAMAFFFKTPFWGNLKFPQNGVLKIESKNQVATREISTIENEKNQVTTLEVSRPENLKIGQIWTHEFFPMIQKVKITEGMTLQDLVYKLNNALASPNFEQLKQEIHDLKKLHDGMDIALDELDKVKRLSPDLTVWNSPILVRKNLARWINFLETLLGDSKSPNEVTIDQIQDFVTVFQSSSGTVDDSKITNCNGWVIDSEAFQINLLNKFSAEDKIEIKNNIENFGKVGFFHLICHIEGKHYIQEDQNVFEAVKETISFIAPEESKEEDYI